MRAHCAKHKQYVFSQFSKHVELGTSAMGSMMKVEVDLQSRLGRSYGYHTSALWNLINTSHRSSTNTKLHSARQFAQHQLRLASRDRPGLRWQSSGTSEKVSGKLNVNELQKSLAKTAVNAKERSTAFGSGVFRRLPAQLQQMVHNARQPGNAQRVLKLQLEAFWQRHSRAVLIVAGIFLVYSLWRTLFYFASVFFKFSESMADLGFLALAAALASFGYLYLRRLYTINPDSVYRKAMYQLNTSPGILEVMGAPVAGSSLRATVVRGGGLRLKGLVPRYRSKKVQMIFPLTGSERRGLVSLEAKKQHGRYLFKLLAVDAPSHSGTEQRIFLEGDQKAYDRGGVINELRDPFLRALSLKESDEVEDDLDDAAHEATEAQRAREKAVAKFHKAPKPLDEGGGMYFYERTYWRLRNAFGGPNVEPSQDKKDQPPSQGEKLNVASDPKPPIDSDATKLHQYKKEASVQQAP